MAEANFTAVTIFPAPSQYSALSGVTRRTLMRGSFLSGQKALSYTDQNFLTRSLSSIISAWPEIDTYFWFLLSDRARQIDWLWRISSAFGVSASVKKKIAPSSRAGRTAIGR